MAETILNPHCSQCKAVNENCCIFGQIESNCIQTFVDKKHINNYKKGDVIFRENNFPLGVFAIHKGKVKVYKNTESGKEYILRLAKEGDILGYRSLISGEKYDVSATALEDARICFIPATVFSEVMKESNQLTFKLMELLSNELHQAERKLADHSTKNVKERVAETILLLRSFYGLDKDGATINVALTREELSNMVGTATETVIRALSDFKDRNIVDIKGKKIIIQNVRLLQQVANVYD